MLLANLKTAELSGPVSSTSERVATNCSWEVSKSAIVEDGLRKELCAPAAWPCFIVGFWQAIQGIVKFTTNISRDGGGQEVRHNMLFHPPPVGVSVASGHYLVPIHPQGGVLTIAAVRTFIVCFDVNRYKRYDHTRIDGGGDRLTSVAREIRFGCGSAL